MDYHNFIQSKKVKIEFSGIDIKDKFISNVLFDYQKDIVKWSLKKGKAAIFSMTGTGKTLMQLEWARQIHIETNSNVLLVSPLAVSEQTIKEAEKLNMLVKYCKDQDDVIHGFNITNYERLHKFDASKFDAIVLDESSILKSFSGRIRQEITDKFQNTRYKLACTATPSPNDFMELGNHSEFLNEMTRSEMLSMFFVHDGGDTSQWRLKGHAQDKFWEWVSTWAVVLRDPGDLGYDNSRFILPPLNINEVIIDTEIDNDEYLFMPEASTLNERRKYRKDTIEDRVQYAANLVNSSDEKWLIWCDLNAESEMLRRSIQDSIEIAGSHDNEYKKENLLKFSNGDIKALVTKPKIAGFGMNWQVCHNIIFCGISDSFEQYFQAVRRCYRFGQRFPVNVYIIISDLELTVLNNIKRKQENFNTMLDSIVQFTHDSVSENIRNSTKKDSKYKTFEKMALPKFMEV